MGPPTQQRHKCPAKLATLFKAWPSLCHMHDCSGALKLSGTQHLGTDPCIVPHGFWHHGMSLPDARASPVSNLGPKVGVLGVLSIVNPSCKGPRVCGIIKCIYSISGPSSWHQAPKTLGISRVKGASFDIHKEPLSITPEFILMR